MRFKKLIKKIEGYDKKADIELIKKAFEFASDSHKDEKRASGEPYVQHPLEVAYIMAELKQDSISIAATLLHDVLENTPVTIEDLKKKFGDEVAMLVDGVTKLSKIKYHDATERDAESIRKMFLATTEDIRVLIIKLADKLHNMRTLQHLPEGKQKRIAQATLDIYAPLANRLGMANIKWELEDIAFKYLRPDMYKKFRDKFGKKRLQREIEVKKIKRTIEKELKKHSIPYNITGRPKHFYSIYTKMLKKHRSFEEIYDLTALRIITDDVKHCYEILGIIHIIWKPIPGEFDDYIAMPKANMYQSLHTAVVGPDGQPIEIQIRTKKMNDIAKEGVAAHWSYKDESSDKNFDKKLSWLRQILDWQKDSKSAKEFMDFLKIDFFHDEIYVFTPQGRVICLPKGSTPLDFAYEVHTNIGNTCSGAIVNGRIVPLRHKLNNGDRINILTSKNQVPKLDWLKIVKTNKAKTKIRKYLKELKKVPIKYGTAKKAKEQDLGEDKIIEFKQGIKNPRIKLAKCCHPLPGSNIVAFLTPPNRISVHLTDCKNIKKYKKSKQVKVEWKSDYNHEIEIKITAEDRVGLFADVLNTIAAAGTNITTAKGKMVTNNLVEIDINMVPEDLDHLEDILDRVKRIQNIKKIAIESK
ncbi:MAG: bifunctional (p)ppGpp synthetase/guanosine-3',5'-bis(diphosphate) 3'-pyrophosphohydrolase [Nanoarchaeota archaeon]|nr:bifunctional (p)ppGpp synthetase/guanosine-3',5'-bis(diphosphate) 3'-pyrophosphohydrolase [Nanoarchaeota archaeon]MCG2718167.1 bifunctional (p)ppGpp synthetase/guanosine-3',5'-bis(diphosphate) 3'-pyrophosphohydrolase [Nanoarchaeota archaeon]